MARFSSIVMSGAVPASGSWNTRPTWAARRWSGWRVTSRPSTTTFPVSGESLPATMLSIVDLPAPVEPMTVVNSPGCSCREIPSRATRSLGVPAKKVFLTESSWSTSVPSRRRRRRGAPQRAQGADAPERAPLRQHQRDDHEDGGDELHVVGVQAHLQGDLDGHAVEHRAERHREGGDDDDPGAEDGLAEDHRGEAGDDEADAHGDVGEALELGDERAAQAHEAVGQREAEDLRAVGVDAEAADHLLVVRSEERRVGEEWRRGRTEAD